MTRLALAAAFIGCALLGGVAGWFVGRHAHGDQAAGTKDEERAKIRALRTGGPTDGDLRRPGPGDDLGRESARAQRDPAYLRSLLQRYAAELDLDRKGALLAVLQSAPNDEVLRFALDLANGTDPRARRDGLALLGAFPLDRAEVRDTLVAQLRAEADPAMQAQLIEMFSPTMMPREDAAPVIDALARLRASPDPVVRAASVLQSAQWDAGGAEAILHRGLLDPDARVRHASVSGVIASGARSDRLKDALLAIASDAQLDDERRHAAVMALQDYSLDRAEYAVYGAAAADVVQEH